MEVESVLEMDVSEDREEFIEDVVLLGFIFNFSFVPFSLLVSSAGGLSLSVTFFFPLDGGASTTAGGGVSLTWGKPACGPRRLRIEEKCSQSWYAT